MTQKAGSDLAFGLDPAAVLPGRNRRQTGVQRVVLQSQSAVVTLSGELTVATAGELRAVLDWLLRWRLPRVLVDLSAVTFLDAAGLQPLLDAHRRSGEWTGRLELLGPCSALDVLLDTVAGLPDPDGSSWTLAQDRHAATPGDRWPALKAEAHPREHLADLN